MNAGNPAYVKLVRPGWRENATARLDRIIRHGDDFGDIANTAGDDLRDVVMLAAERMRGRSYTLTEIAKQAQHLLDLDGERIPPHVQLWLRDLVADFGPKQTSND